MDADADNDRRPIMRHEDLRRTKENRIVPWIYPGSTLDLPWIYPSSTLDLP